MAAAIARGDVTAEAIVRDCLDRIDEREAIVGAWAFVDRALALSQARDRDRSPSKGALHGVPIGIKDIIDTADMPTEMGSPIYRGYRPRADAACVALSRAAGAVILGKTVTAEFAGVTPGKTAHPLDPAHTPSGSSSGSAAAVADFMVPAALGTQTGGSVIRPAAFCGVFGYKPSFGRFNRAGVKPAAESFDTIGLIARTIDDLRLVDAALIGETVAPLLPAEPPVVGLCRTHLWQNAEAATVAAIEDTAARLAAAGATVIEIELPDEFATLTGARERINNYERARALAYEWHYHRALISDRLCRAIERGFALSHEDYGAAMALTERCRARIGEIFGRVEILLTPATPGEAPMGLDSTGDPRFQEMWTQLHLPALTLPTHRGPAGLPVGIQLVAPAACEDRLFAIGTWIWDRLRGG